MRARILSGIFLFLFVMLTPLSAWAQGEPSVFVRFYYSSWMNGEAAKTPLDPLGDVAGGEGLKDNKKTELEFILWQRIGLSGSRYKLSRGFMDDTGASALCAGGGCNVAEEGLFTTYNLTLYGRNVTHNQFNFFVGSGSGKADYAYYLEGVKQDQGDLFSGLSAKRHFVGFEYTFSRIGFRFEINKISASKTYQGKTAEVEEFLKYLTIFIPIN